MLVSNHRPWMVGWGSRRRAYVSGRAGNCIMKPRGTFKEWKEVQLARPGLKKGRETREGAASISSCRALNANGLHCQLRGGVREAVTGDICLRKLPPCRVAWKQRDCQDGTAVRGHLDQVSGPSDCWYALEGDGGSRIPSVYNCLRACCVLRVAREGTRLRGN